MGIPPKEGSTEVVKLEQTSVARLLFELLRGRFTGTLEMSQPPPHSGERTVWFQGGMPVFTDWFDERDSLGQIAVEQDAIGKDDLRKAMAEKTAGQLLGDALEKMGAIDAEKLREALRTQCKRKLAHLFALKSGQMVVRRTDHGVGKGDGLGQVSVLELILMGVTEHYDETRVALEMGEAATGHLTATGSLGRYAAHFRFMKGDKPILQALARGSNLDHLASLSGVGSRRAAQVTFTLWCCEMLETGTAPVRDAHITGPMTAYVEAVRRQKGLAGKAADPQDEEVEELGDKMKAEAALSAQRYAAAHKAFMDAAMANPEDGEVAAGIAWCVYHLSPQGADDGEEAVSALARVIGKHPKVARAHYYRGVILQDLGRNTDAADALKMAVTLDPHLKDAARRARALAGMPSTKKKRGERERPNPFTAGKMPLLLAVGGALILAMLLANVVLGLDG
jgi:tetratricopeptide (TPR) repeat protein